jgi:hypothetical protein
MKPFIYHDTDLDRYHVILDDGKPLSFDDKLWTHFSWVFFNRVDGGNEKYGFKVNFRERDHAALAIKIRGQYERFMMRINEQALEAGL